MSLTETEEVKPELLVQGWIPPRLDREFTVVGKPLDRMDGVEKVTGTAAYAGDIKLPGMLHAKILRSPHAHARIRRIDTSRAEALPGVKAVISTANCPGWFTYWYKVAQPAFPEIVTYVGQEVAAVAAEDVDTAQKAVKLIEVDYETLPAVFDAEEAMKPGAPIVNVGDVPDLAPDCYGPTKPPVGNVYDGHPFLLTRGDVTKGFEEADLILERVYRTAPQHHGSLQTRTCVVHWTGEKLLVQESCQGVFNSRRDISLSLGLAPEKVEVRVKYEGGGFGSKAGAQRFVQYASRLSILTKRPVRLELTRAEEFVSHPRRPSAVVYLKTGLKRDGTLTAMYGKAIVNIGSGGGYRPFTKQLIGHPFVLYKCPNAYFEQWGVHTNLQYTGPMRSPLEVVGCSAVEAHIDELADAVGVDPLEFRFRNYTIYADQVNKTRFSSKKLDQAMELVTDAIGWSRRSRSAAMAVGGPKKRGIGMASYIYHGTGKNPCKALADVTIRRDGSVELRIGIVEIGGGGATALSMIAAEELGVGLGDIHTIYGDTARTQFAPASHASRTIPEMGPAVLQAAAAARDSLFKRVAEFLKVDPKELRSSNGEIFLKSDPSKKTKFKEMCRLVGDGGVTGSGSRSPNPSNNMGPDVPDPQRIGLATFGAATAEVEVDVETGEVTLLKIATAHEFGRALNPKFCDSQHYGGIAMGIGFALLEEPALDKKTGIMLNTDLHQYRMPTSLDMPSEVVPFNVENEDRYYAYSAKGGGEGMNSAVPAAIRNAIHDATGVWLNEYPLSRERIITAMRERSSAPKERRIAQPLEQRS